MYMNTMAAIGQHFGQKQLLRFLQNVGSLFVHHIVKVVRKVCCVFGLNVIRKNVQMRIITTICDFTNTVLEINRIGIMTERTIVTRQAGAAKPVTPTQEFLSYTGIGSNRIQHNRRVSARLEDKNRPPNSQTQSLWSGSNSAQFS